MNPIERHVILSLTVLVRPEVFAASIGGTVTVDGPLDALSTTIDYDCRRRMCRNERR